MTLSMAFSKLDDVRKPDKLTAKNAKSAKLKMFFLAFFAGLAVQRIFLH